jgi:hypothetical protein
MTTVESAGRSDQCDTARADFMAESEVAAIAALRRRGFAVILFNADELEGASPKLVEGRLVELGWDVIQCLSHVDARGSAAVRDGED